jgi:tRNA-Thr(GGU) m(6)t(6)A37 methyltransferase TsaA
MPIHELESQSMTDETYSLRPIGWVESSLTDRENAPRQSDEGAPSARIVLRADVLPAARNLAAGDEMIVLTWLHQSQRDVLAVYPRGDESRPITGVFSTRSPDRPNPIGLHTVTIAATDERSITVRHLEAIDGTPVVDIKPVLRGVRDR